MLSYLVVSCAERPKRERVINQHGHEVNNKEIYLVA